MYHTSERGYIQVVHLGVVRESGTIHVSSIQVRLLHIHVGGNLPHEDGRYHITRYRIVYHTCVV